MVTEKAVAQAQEGNTSFLRAARSGNLDRVLEFIRNNVEINTANSNGLNALHLSSKDGHVEVVKELIKCGANVDAATKKGNTALHIASLAGQDEVVKLLVANGASVNVQSQSGFTPLYMAAQENHEKVVRFLLNNGASQSLCTEDGFTPLAVAMQQGHDRVVTELLENDTRGKIRLPALHIAAKKDDCKAASLLLQSEHNPDITSKSGFTPLHIASHYGNESVAVLLLKKGADVNYCAKHNITPLHVASKWGRNNMVLLLVENGASIVGKTRDGLTPLHCAARSGHAEVVDTLIQKHAPITSKTKNGLAPLHMASQGDHVEAARILLLYRAPVDDVTIDYLTALHVASHCGHVAVATLLLERKADPNARALNGFTPLHIACKKNRIKIVELLLKYGASIEATTESGLSPLHVASFMGCMNIVIYLLQCGANADVCTVRGETPLHLAARASQTDIIRILLRNGAQVDAKAREQQTPLHVAARLKNVDIVMLLLQHGASVDSVTKDEYTALHIAVKEGQDEVAQVLLENNASVMAQTKKGFTPLHLAAKYGRMSIANVLLQRGAPVDTQGKNGVTPLHVACHYDNQPIALLLLHKGSSPHAVAKNGHTPLHIAAKKNQMDIASRLLEYGADANVESKAGFIPLHLSAQEGHTEMSKLLLVHKANVNSSSKNGLTPLHLCAQEDSVNVAKLLIENHADVNNVTKAGYTPLHIASHFGQLNMVRFLLANGIKADAKTNTGNTAMHQAAQQGNSAIVATLLDHGCLPDTKNSHDQTALYIAQKLGYISVVETLKNVTDVAITSPSDEKYKVVAPEMMQENFMSDSEDEGGEDAILTEQSYRYLTIDEMKSLGDDSLPIDVSREDRYDTTAGMDDSISPQHSFIVGSSIPDNVQLSRIPHLNTGFLVSFLVDARGGTMRGCRHSGVRVIIPPKCAAMPTRITCRYSRKERCVNPAPPPLMEGEALASRILELGPVGAKFLGPVVIEVPHFASLRSNEREIIVLRCDNGETWREHAVDSNPEIVQQIASANGGEKENVDTDRITRIVTTDFPLYFAIISRIRQEVHTIGPEGGMLSSTVVPQVQAVFPQGSLTKKIKVGLQAQPICSELTAKVLGNCVAVSPIVTIEPRRRKFHKPITLTLPVPQAANKGMINQYSGEAPTLRLLCSITGGTSKAQWEDVTGSTPLTFVKECVSFTTTVSARFWLMDIRDISVAPKKATELYKETTHVPFMAKFVVFAKKIDNLEARLRVFCMTDDKEDKTLECQEHFIEVAKSRDVEVLEDKTLLVELGGNFAAVATSGSGQQLKISFKAFNENRLPFKVRIKDALVDPIGRMLFFNEQKSMKTNVPHAPICVLNIFIPDGNSFHRMKNGVDNRRQKYLKERHVNQGAQLRLSDISNLIGDDWVPLSQKLGIQASDVEIIRREYPDSVPMQALTMLRTWRKLTVVTNSENMLESALMDIGRDDIIDACIVKNCNDTIKEEGGSHIFKGVPIADTIVEDYDRKKSDEYMHGDIDETKYTPEEKAIAKKAVEEEDIEMKKSVCEIRHEIERKLQEEKATKKGPPSRENSKILNDKRNSISKRDSSYDIVEKQDIMEKKTSNSLEDREEDVIEPESLTFEQKRLSFERGASFDIPKWKPTCSDVAATSGPADKTEIKITEEISDNVDDAEMSRRRDSELFEKVSLGLVHLDENSTLAMDPKSPKKVKPPPPTPIRDGEMDSEDNSEYPIIGSSHRNFEVNKSASIDEEEILTTETNKIDLAPVHPTDVGVSNFSAEKLDYTDEGTTAIGCCQEEENKCSNVGARCRDGNAAPEIRSEMEIRDEEGVFIRMDDKIRIENGAIMMMKGAADDDGTDGDSSPVFHYEGNKDEIAVSEAGKGGTDEMICQVGEDVKSPEQAVASVSTFNADFGDFSKQNQKWSRADEIRADSADVANCSPPIVTTPTTQRRSNLIGGSQRLTQREKSLLKVIKRNADGKYSSDSEEDELNGGGGSYIVTEPGERSPQSRKVAFRLNSEQDDVVYPGDTDSNEEEEEEEEDENESEEEEEDEDDVGVGEEGNEGAGDGVLMKEQNNNEIDVGKMKYNACLKRASPMDESKRQEENLGLAVQDITNADDSMKKGMNWPANMQEARCMGESLLEQLECDLEKRLSVSSSGKRTPVESGEGSEATTATIVIAACKDASPPSKDPLPLEGKEVYSSDGTSEGSSSKYATCVSQGLNSNAKYSSSNTLDFYTASDASTTASISHIESGDASISDADVTMIASDTDEEMFAGEGGNDKIEDASVTKDVEKQSKEKTLSSSTSFVEEPYESKIPISVIRGQGVEVSNEDGEWTKVKKTQPQLTSLSKCPDVRDSTAMVDLYPDLIVKQTILGDESGTLQTDDDGKWLGGEQQSELPANEEIIREMESVHYLKEENLQVVDVGEEFVDIGEEFSDIGEELVDMDEEEEEEDEEEEEETTVIYNWSSSIRDDFILDTVCEEDVGVASASSSLGRQMVEYDVLAGKKFFCSDAAVVGSGTSLDSVAKSLQEFETLERLVAMEGGFSDDSCSSYTREKKEKEETSSEKSSLHQFEMLEDAAYKEVAEECATTPHQQKILYEIEEGHESQASETSESCGDTVASDHLVNKCVKISPEESVPVVKGNGSEQQEPESLGRGDSLEEVAKMPELDLDDDALHGSNNNSNSGNRRYKKQK